ncbi:hypothetical protein E8E11_010010 [Didymella keratinophila]|nr:hypothetical protein E8E11_010010 [Didymella keratinophila]
MNSMWVQRHMDNTFRNCKENTLEVAPAAFPSLPIDQPRPDSPRSPSPPRFWRRKPDPDDWTSTSSRSPPSPCNPRRKRRSPPPRQAREPSPLKNRSPPPSTTRQNAPCVLRKQKAQKTNEIGLSFAPSLLRDPNEVHIVNKITWNTIDFWYALPPVDLRTTGRAIQGEHDRLQQEGTLQQRACRPKMDSMRQFTTLEELVAQRKTLQTKLQLLKYKTAKLLNPKKPSTLPPAFGFMRLQFEEQRLRENNRRLALDVNDLLERAKIKQLASIIPLYVPLKGAFASTPADRTGRAAVGDQGLRQNALAEPTRKIKAQSRRTHKAGPSNDSLDWPVPEDVAEFGGSDATDWDTPDDDSTDPDLPERNLPERKSIELREVSASVWNRKPTPPPSQSYTSSKAADTEASGPQQAPLIPQTSKRKAEASSSHKPLLKEHMAKFSLASKEDEPLPEELQGPLPKRYLSYWEYREGEENAASIWPLVQSVTISTGSLLLNSGVQFFDLPGDGDLNQIRKAVINEYRRQADFEPVVADPCRYSTNEGADDYLRRAVQQHGSANTALRYLTIPIDELVSLIDALDEEPFLTLNTKTSSTTHKKRKAIVEQARRSYGKHQVNEIKAHLPLTCKDVAVHTASATKYLELLGDIGGRCERIKEKYEIDKGFTRVRKDLQERILGLFSTLTSLFHGSIRDRTPKPWLHYDMSVSSKLRGVESSWSGSVVAHQTFTHMIRERGISTNRSLAAGRNLNKEILVTSMDHVERREQKAVRMGDIICTLIDAPVQDLFKDLQKRFDRTPVDPDLKRTANDAPHRTIVRISVQHGNLVRDLEASAVKTAKDYTIEETLCSPVARNMASAYAAVSSMQGRGINAHRHTNLFKRVRSLVDSMPQRMVDQVNRHWKHLCERFVELAEEHLTRLTEIMEELLENEPDPSSEHAQAVQDDDDISIKSEEDDDACGYAPLYNDASVKPEDDNDDFYGGYPHSKTQPGAKRVSKDAVHRPAKRAKDSSDLW